jgi:hypothetical protein
LREHARHEPARVEGLKFRGQDTQSTHSTHQPVVLPHAAYTRSTHAGAPRPRVDAPVALLHEAQKLPSCVRVCVCVCMCVCVCVCVCVCERERERERES